MNSGSWKRMSLVNNSENVPEQKASDERDRSAFQNHNDVLEWKQCFGVVGKDREEMGML